ncbi:MAG: filamentous hemagglutinin N-terminal domain-containing protein [Acidovorax sp.]|jgi:filamentous hemagglutinin family protein|nr:filamentous hemagglutinin N-terminal domain-containing protein [Acidovorax sp.]
MNHIFSSIWNHSLGAWVAASEHTRRGRQRGGSTSRSRDHKASAPPMTIGTLQVAVLLACGWLGGTVVHAADLPTGFSAVSGSATLSQSANSMTISQSGKVSLINWTGFDIATGNTVTFNMPSASSGSINIISGNASTISGSLNSIGNVILVNTNGIVFNNGSAVNVGSLLATSLQPDTSGLSLAAGAELPLSWTLTGSNAPAAIINRGDINASSGGISLIGGVVENSGSLAAASNASLIVGSKVQSFLMQPSNPSTAQPGSWEHIITANASTGGSWAINNTGRISGSAIDLRAQVGNGLYSGGINSVGVLQAQGIDGGRLVVSTNASAVLDFGMSTTIGNVSAFSSSLGTQGTLNANSISLQATGALNLGATLNGGDISLSGSAISQQYDGNEGALKGSVSLQTPGDAMLDSSSNAISHLDGTVGLGLVLASTTDVTQNAALTVGGSTLLNGLAGSSGAVAGFTFDRADNSFGNAISGIGGALVLNSSGALNLGTLDVGSLAAQGSAIRLGGNISSVGSQTYTGPLTLLSGATLSSSGGGALSFSGTVNGANALTLDTNGAVTFGAAVGGSTALASLRRIGNGTTRLNGNVTTSGAIGIEGNVLLGADVRLGSTAGQAISLEGTVDSAGTARALIVDTSGATSFGGAVGASNALASLQTLGGGTTQLGGSVTTSGAINLQDNLLLGSNVALTSTGNQGITLGGSVDSAGGARTLTLTSNGLATLGGSVGGSSALSSLRRTGTGGTLLGGNITTTGDIVLQGGLQATGSTAISSTGNGRIDVGGSILANGGVALSGGDIIVGGDISAASVGIDGATFSGAGITSNDTLDINVRNGALLQNGAYSAGGTASFAAAGDIVLGNAQNQFGNTVALNGGNVVLANAGSLRLGYTNAQTLQVNAAGSITQAATTGVDVTGTSSFSAAGGISLLQAGNRFGGAVSLGGGGGAQVAASGGLRFGTLGVSSLLASADTVYLPQLLTTLGGQSYSGRLVLEGDTALSSTLGALAFTGTLEGPHALSLHASGTVSLGATADIGSLGSTATETQLAADLTTVGDISLANTRVVGDVALTSTAGSVQINGVVNGLQDNSDSLSIAADGQIALLGAVGNAERLHDLSLSAATVSTVAVDVGNRLAIDSIASINQGGRYGVGGTARFASNGDITLLHSSNAFGGDVELAGNHVQIAAQGPLSLSGVDADLLLATSGDQLSVRDARVASSSTLTGQAVMLDEVALGQTAEVVALGGNITQQGGVRVDGPSRWIAAGNVLLGNGANQLDGAVTAQGNTVSVTTAGALDVANVQASGQATLRGNGVHLGSLQAMGLEVDSGAGITQGSALTLASASRFTAVDDVLLDNAGNTFGGGVQLVGRNIDIHSAGGLLLNGVDASGNLRATAAGGSLLQSGDVRVQGRSDLLAGGSVQLDRAGNLFTGAVAVEGQSILLRASSGLNMESVRNGSNGAVHLVAAGNIDVAGDAIDTGNSLLSLSSSGGQVRTATALRGGQVSIGGVEGIRIGGDITATTLAMTSARNDVLQQSGRIQTGNALLSAGQGDLRLTSADNRFTGVTALYGRDVDVAAGGLLLGDVAASGNLRLDSSGSITQQAQMRVTGTSDLRAAGDIALDHAGNHFGGSVALAGSNVAIASDHAGLALADVHAATLEAGSQGALSLANATVAGTTQLQGSSVALGRTDVGGAFTATATSTDITQTDRLSVGGNSQLQAANAITLDRAQNHFGGRVDLHAASAKLGTDGSLALGDVTADRLQASATQGLQLQGHIAATTVDLATAGAFDNQTGADAIRVGGNGRWHVYLDAPDQGHQFGGLDSGNTAVWNTQALGATSAAGNRYLFAWSPTLTLEGMALSKNLGTVLDISQAYTWSGLMPGVANAYRADSLTEVLGGNIRVTSAGAAGDAAVQSRPYSIELDASHLDLSQSGYQLVLRPGELRITSTQDSAAYQSAIRLPVTAVAEQPLPPTASYVARIAGGMQRPTSRCTALTTDCVEE